MERKNLEITYQKISDYLIPNIVLPKEATRYNIGKYGYLRLEYIKEHKRGRKLIPFREQILTYGIKSQTLFRKIKKLR